MSLADPAPFNEHDRNFLKSFGWIPPRLIDATLAALPPNSLPTEPVQRRQWLLYALLQRTADARNIDSLYWANDERIKDYLKSIADGELPGDLTELGRWLKNLPSNRAQKHARRRHLLERYRNDLRRPESPRPEGAAEQDDILALVRRMTSACEWDLLNRVATDGLGAVAREERLPLGTLKSRLSRLRHRLRQAC
jgi:hypothetical protein